MQLFQVYLKPLLLVDLSSPKDWKKKKVIKINLKKEMGYCFPSVITM